MNHVAQHKNWDRLVFVGINYSIDKSIGKFMEKTTFDDLLHNNKQIFDMYFSIQQGGKNSNNDDYISSGKKLENLLNSEYMKDLSQW